MCPCRLGLEEGFTDLMARLPKLHAQRVAAEAAAYEDTAAILRAAHEAECAMVQKLNDDIQRWRHLLVHSILLVPNQITMSPCKLCSAAVPA